MLRAIAIGLTLLFLFITPKSVAQPYLILFITQISVPSDVNIIGTTPGNNQALMKQAVRVSNL